MLARYQPEPGCQVAAVLEVGAVADCRYHRGCSLRSDSSDLGYPLTNIAGFEDRSDLAIKSFDAFVDLKHESIQARDDLTHHISQLIDSSSPRTFSSCSRRTRRTNTGRPFRSTPWSWKTFF